MQDHGSRVQAVSGVATALHLPGVVLQRTIMTLFYSPIAARIVPALTLNIPASFWPWSPALVGC
jgi:hypothetical protein